MRPLLSVGLAAMLSFSAAQPAVALTDGGVEVPPPVDPARLALAGKTVDYLFPLGTYERMMRGTLDQIMDSVLGSIGDMKASDFAKASGLPEGEVTEGEQEKSISELASEKDPHFEERMRISTKVMMDEMITLMTDLEPEIRTVLADVYARKYDAGQLAELNAFFGTSTGSQFASDYMMVFVDPQMISAMTGLTPKLMGAMPGIMEKVAEATAHLPPPVPQSEETVEEETASTNDA